MKVLLIIVGIVWSGCVAANPQWLPPTQVEPGVALETQLVTAIQRHNMFHVGVSDMRTIQDRHGNTQIKFSVTDISAKPEWYADIERLLDANGSVIYQQDSLGDRVTQWVLGLIPYVAAGQQYLQGIGNKLVEPRVTPDMCFMGSRERELRCYVMPNIQKLAAVFNRGRLEVQLLSNGVVISTFPLPNRVPLLNRVSFDQPFKSPGLPDSNQFLMVGPNDVPQQIVINLGSQPLPDGLSLDVSVSFKQHNH